MRNARHTSIMGILAIKSNAKAAAISYYWPRDVYCKSMVKEMHQQRSVTKFDWYVGIYLVQVKRKTHILRLVLLIYTKYQELCAADPTTTHSPHTRFVTSKTCFSCEHLNTHTHRSNKCCMWKSIQRLERITNPKETQLYYM